MQDERGDELDEPTTATPNTARRFWIAAALAVAWAVALALYEVYGAARHGKLLVGCWALGLFLLCGWGFARAARGERRRSFVTIATAVLGVGALGIVAGTLAASSGYPRWRASAMASVAQLDTPEDRERGRRVLEAHATYAEFVLVRVIPRAGWPAAAILPIAIVVAALGATELRA